MAADDPEHAESVPPSSGSIEIVIAARAKDLGGFSVRRLLPHARRRSVGPFVFLDHMGPAHFPPGSALDVRPHPHINLATVTYLFEGEIIHKDSLGSDQAITPGAINWMTAGRGIVHSERQRPEEKARGPRLHGLQVWIALPTEFEEVEPEFVHYPASVIPVISEEGRRIAVLLGDAFGQTSPVRTYSPTLYADLLLTAGQDLALPSDYEERALYLLEGRLAVDDQVFDGPCLLVLRTGATPLLRAETDVHATLLGGAPLDGPRHMFWNFVSSRPERIEQAKADWKNGRFGTVPGDDIEFIPLPEG